MTIHRQQLAHDQINIRREMDYIVERAIERDARVVTLGAIVLFSTDTGDAWMLDSEEQWAMCLARSGDPQPAQVTETTECFTIEWNLSYQIKGEQFIVTDSSGRTRTILGYPMREIAQAIQQAKLTGAAASDGRTSRGTPARLQGLASLFKRDAQTEVAQQIKNLIKAGYDLLRGVHRQEGAACDQWLEAWALIKQVARSEMRTVAAFDRIFFHGQPVVANWVDDFDNELHNAGLDQPIYHEHRLRYLRELLAQFPDENTDAQVNFGRGQGEALWELGRRAESEAVYASLIQQFPNKGWAYIGWSDAYYLGHNSPKEYERAEAILKQALARRDLHDRLDVLDRLCELYADWRQPAKLAKAEEQLEQAAQEAQGAHIDLGQPVRVEPVSPSRTAPSKPLGRNELCWCGSGKKYKHCHLKADQEG